MHITLETGEAQIMVSTIVQKQLSKLSREGLACGVSITRHISLIDTFSYAYDAKTRDEAYDNIDNFLKKRNIVPNFYDVQSFVDNIFKLKEAANANKI